MRHTRSNCAHEAKHIARQRGSRLRMRCDDCGHLSNWMKADPGEATEQIDLQPLLTDEPGEITKLTGSNSVHTALQARHDSLNDLTVPELRTLAKDGGVKGYSKMTKHALVIALTAGLPTR